MDRLSNKRPFFIISLLVLANILAWMTVYDLSKPQFLEVYFFDVGQGDSTFIESPGGHQILIDGGPDEAVLEKLGKVMPFWDRSIDVLVLTHPDSDHLSGLIEVLKRYEVNYVLETDVFCESEECFEWTKTLQEEKPEIVIAKSGGSMKEGEVKIDILYPFESLKGTVPKEINNTSAVLKLTFGEVSFFFPGDIFQSAEKEITGNLSKELLDADILKVSHHGSKISSSNDFLSAVLPELAIVSVGAEEDAQGKECDNKQRNKYSHPNCEVLERLASYGIKLLRTDKNGDIKISSDGRNFKVICSN